MSFFKITIRDTDFFIIPSKAPSAGCKYTQESKSPLMAEYHLSCQAKIEVRTLCLCECTVCLCD